MDRRSFIVGSASFALACGRLPAAPTGRLVTTQAPPRNPRPYSDVDWKSSLRVNTTSHGHCDNQKMLDAYVRHRFGLLTISNYYPSAPRLPGATFTRDHYQFRQTHEIVYRGRRVPPPKDWNAVIAAWADELPEDVRRQLPLRESSARLFSNFPKDVLEAPNAEHHAFLLANGKPAKRLHLCAPGSACATGTFDKRDRFGTARHGYCYGSGEFWGTAIDRMIEGLVIPDGGGVTINHPTWSSLDGRLLLDLLDWDPRVLGLEVLESGVNSESRWDEVLATGRQCFGFFVPDWGVANDVFGVNVLLVKERTVEACLRAYRKGDFYGAARGLGELNFTGIAFDGKTLRVAVDKPATLRVKTARGIVRETTGLQVVWPVPKDGVKSDVFVRVTARGATGEQLFTQPFVL